MCALPNTKGKLVHCIAQLIEVTLIKLVDSINRDGLGMRIYVMQHMGKVLKPSKSIQS